LGVYRPMPVWFQIRITGMWLGRFFLVLTSCASFAHAQWTLEESNTKSNLSSIHYVGAGIAWASGDQGTVLRTTDDGATWQHCATPADAERLDFRGIHGFDESTAIVMSSNPGAGSRLYRTTDGCGTRSLVFTNPDAPKGSFRVIYFPPRDGRGTDQIGYGGYLIGDPVPSDYAILRVLIGEPMGYFADFTTGDDGKTWARASEGAWRKPAKLGETVSSASNSSFLIVRGWPLFVTSGSVTRSRTLEEHVKHDPHILVGYVGGNIPLARGLSGGAASVAAHLSTKDSVADPNSKYIVRAVQDGDILVAVGGDETHSKDSAGTCAFSTDGGLHWTASETPPRGYRSAVAYDTDSKTWITVGPNGTDISSDEGRTWRPLKPSPSDSADADKNWNALSFPFAVGRNGRIGKLTPDAMKH